MGRYTLAAIPALAALVAGLACSGEPPSTSTLDEGPELSGVHVTDGLSAHRPAVTGLNGLVTAGHPLASMAGMEILLRGGTAADAAVAILATLHQVEPMMSGIGGNGFFTIFDARSGEVVSLNAAGAAPASLDASALTPNDLFRGMKAGVVPGLFGGWTALLERFGTMSLREVLEPAIRHAERGHPIAPFVSQSIAANRALLGDSPGATAMFLPGGRPPEAGHVLRFPDLALTLRKLVEAEDTARAAGASRGRALQAAFDRFYKGDFARQMARFYERNGGLFTRADFARYAPVWAEPVHTVYQGYDVYSSPATSRGGAEVALQLNLAEGYDFRGLPQNSTGALHVIAETIKLAKADVYAHLADPATIDVPMAGLLSKAYAASRRGLIATDPSAAMVYPEPGTPPGATAVARTAALAVPARVVAAAPDAERSRPGSTTSFTVVDQDGNVVVATPTLGSPWGTGVAVDTTGIIFNNGTRHGSTAPYPEHINYARGGQIPLLNNSPTIVLRNGAFHLALGTPGGETIAQTEYQVLLNVLSYGMGIQEAIEAPRIALVADPNFYKAGSHVRIEAEERIAPRVLADLEALGHDVEAVPGWSIGNMQGVLVDPETGTMTAGADPRRMMYAIGW